MRHKVLYMFLILMTAEAIFYYWQASRTSTVKLQRNNKHKINKNHAKRKPIDTKIKKNKKIQKLPEMIIIGRVARISNFSK